VPKLALFPLPSTVVFPGMTLPLFVFEERYRKLVRYCQEQNLKQFIITLAKPENVSDTKRPFHRVGTVMTILDMSENADGTFELLAHGQDRTLIEITHTEHIAEADGSLRPLYYSDKSLLPLERCDPNQERIAAWDAFEVFRKYATTFFAFDALKKIDNAIPEDLIFQASFICANIRIPAEERQLLLETLNLKERFQLAQSLMEKHIEAYAPPKNL
jgi:ATP-dependent Lon protease